MASPGMSDDGRSQYRQALIDSSNVALDAFDAAILKLSAGALALALGFVRTPQPIAPELLFGAWAALALSMLCTLRSFLASHDAHRRALIQLDDQLQPERIYQELAGGIDSARTSRLNRWAFGLFTSGILLLAAFVGVNLEHLK